jgi:response regulator RpfG family c-di-GMP phosphodiesterase
MPETQARSTILVVDDERGPRESLRMILSPRFEVVPARSGPEALALLRSRIVDLVTLDLHMPGMRGDELMRSIHDEFPQVPMVVITGCGSLETAVEGLRNGVSDYLQKPFDVVQVTAAVTRALARRAARGRLVSFLDELGRLAGREREAQEILSELRQSGRMRGRLGELFDAAGQRPAASPARAVEFLEVLAETIESRDPFLRGHARRVAYYASLLAHRLELSQEETEHVRISAFFHDLGKIGVPGELLQRPGALSPAERGQVERHTEIGARLIAPLDVPAQVRAGVRHHHEWWDGTGYPDGLAGQQIPLAARIVAVADAFDAMSSDRPYRRALERPLVEAELRQFSGSQFDPALVKEFAAILETGVCEVDPELLAEVVTATTQRGDPGPMVS